MVVKIDLFTQIELKRLYNEMMQQQTDEADKLACSIMEYISGCGCFALFDEEGMIERIYESKEDFMKACREKLDKTE